jgi:hypothetical protein
MPKCIKIIFFIFLKIIFEISASKWFKTHKKLIFNKKIIFLRTRFALRSQTVPKQKCIKLVSFKKTNTLIIIIKKLT